MRASPLRALANLDVATHLAEEVHDTSEHNEEDTTSWTEPENLGQEALVEGTETFLAHDGTEGGPCPVVLGHGSDNLGRVLDARLHNVHGSVENGTDCTTDGTGHEIVGDLALLGSSLRQEGADLEDTAEVTGVPENVAPHSRLETLVKGERALILYDLRKAVHHAVVLVRLRLVLKSNLDELEGDNDEGFGRTSSCASENGKRLIHLGLTEEVAVERSPGVVSGELGGPMCISASAEVGW